MDPFELLKTDHKKVAQLFDELEAAAGTAKLGIFDQIKNELELHTHIEEKVFYPALENPEETHDLTLEAYEEHSVVKTLLAELASSRSADDEWQAKAKVLRENVEHHVSEEEKELFDKADDALSDEQLEKLGDQMAAEKARKGSPVENAAAPGKVKATKSSKSKTAKGGILSKIANFVGLGKKSGSKKASAAKKKSAKGKAKSAATKSKASKKAAKKSASKKTAATSASKRSPAKKGSKKASKASKSSKGLKASKARRASGKKKSGKKR